MKRPNCFGLCYVYDDCEECPDFEDCEDATAKKEAEGR